ncbi:L10-interacting MYB domain-containing protein-like [Rhodamnia argentea]|uniref:L10-interacting MYB domain-containing protein-like n=1 Tax=Rhodamnia argentea TaxID=178133 RepID=A0A8B8NBB4_9MYRT|nr:L10-interacting MYB domain-containing protein-like [Rhodamnia argentea]
MGKNYNKIQMKSKWDNLKEEWKRWKTLIYSETGLGWDDKKKTIAAIDKWWNDKIKDDYRFKPFRMKGIHPDFDMLLAKMFSSIVATRGITWNPGQGLRIEEDVDATQPNIADVDVSADEILESEGCENVVEQNATQTRKRVMRTSTRQARGKKEKRMTPQQQLGNQIERMVSAVEGRSNSTCQPDYEFGPYKDLMQLVDSIPEIVQDEKLYFFAIKHFKEKKDNWQVFMSLNSDALKVKYLKFEMEELSNI